MNLPFATSVQRPGFLSRAAVFVSVLLPAAAIGWALVRGFALPVAALAVGFLLLVLSGFSLASVIGMASLSVLVPATVFPFVNPEFLIIFGELSLAMAIILLSRNAKPDPRVMWPALGFVLLVALAAQRGASTHEAVLSPWLDFAAISAQILLVASGTGRKSTDDELFRFARWGILVGGLLSIWAVAEVILGHGLSFPFLSGARRAVGPVGSPNYLGTALAQLVVLNFALARVRKTYLRQSALLPLVGGMACLAGLAATLSRGSAIACLAGLIVLAVTGARRTHRRLVLATVIVGLGAIGPYAWGALSAERTRSLPVESSTLASAGDEVSLRARFEAARVGISDAFQHPITGLGLGQFQVLAARDPRLGLEINTHNEPIRIAAEAGLLAALLLTIAVLGMVRRVRFRSVRVRCVVLPVAVSYLVASVFINALDFVRVGLPTFAVLFFGVASVAARSSEESVEEGTTAMRGGENLVPS